MATDIQVIVRFERAALDAVDRVRGDVPRAAWIRRLCEQAVIAAGALDEAQGSVGGRGVDAPGTAAEPAGSSPVPEPPRAPVPAIPGVVRGSEVDQPGPMLGGPLPADDAEWPPPEPGL